MNTSLGDEKRKTKNASKKKLVLFFFFFFFLLFSNGQRDFKARRALPIDAD